MTDISKQSLHKKAQVTSRTMHQHFSSNVYLISRGNLFTDIEESNFLMHANNTRFCTILLDIYKDFCKKNVSQFGSKTVYDTYANLLPVLILSRFHLVLSQEPFFSTVPFLSLYSSILLVTFHWHLIRRSSSFS